MKHTTHEPDLAKWILWIKDERVPVEVVAEQLVKAEGLAPSTATRKAREIVKLAWGLNEKP